MIFIKKWIIFISLGLITGVLNGLFGAGGGMALIPLLNMQNIKDKQSHGTCLAVILILSLVSIFMYNQKGVIDFALSFKYIPYGVIGALAGGFIMSKISTNLLKKVFGVLMLIFGIRMFI